jgi:FkbM family methyltransferase
MINYDFVEVGTCFFDTLIEKADDNTIGLSIEPIKMYQDKLLNKKNVIKINAALVSDDDLGDGSIDFYYVHEDIIKKHQLGAWLTGCNTVNKPHDFHVAYYPDPGEWHLNQDKSKLRYKSYNLMEMGLVNIDSVKCLTFKNLVDEYDIDYIKYLKVDVEGYDCKIVNSVLDYFVEYDKCPDKIYFESNSHSNKVEVSHLTKRLQLLGYKLVITQFDTLANKR